MSKELPTELRNKKELCKRRTIKSTGSLLSGAEDLRVKDMDKAKVLSALFTLVFAS